jgi:hypothetical protein
MYLVIFDDGMFEKDQVKFRGHRTVVTTKVRTIAKARETCTNSLVLQYLSTAHDISQK